MSLKKDQQELIDFACGHGWRDHHRKGGHTMLIAPNGQKVFAPSTPSDYRAIKNLEAQMRRQGLPRRDGLDMNKNTNTKVPPTKETPAKKVEYNDVLEVLLRAGGPVKMTNLVNKVKGQSVEPNSAPYNEVRGLVKKGLKKNAIHRVKWGVYMYGPSPVPEPGPTPEPEPTPEPYVEPVKDTFEPKDEALTWPKGKVTGVTARSVASEKADPLFEQVATALHDSTTILLQDEDGNYWTARRF